MRRAVAGRGSSLTLGKYYALDTSSSVVHILYATGPTFQRWTPEQRVLVVRALASKGLPSLLDMMVYLDGREEGVLNAKRIKDEFEYSIAMDLLKEDALTVRQRLKVNRMVLAFEAEKLKASRLRK